LEARECLRREREKEVEDMMEKDIEEKKK